MKLVISVLALCFAAAAQTATGTIQGTVTDGSGGAIAGAKATILNTKTGIRQTIATGNQGGFIQPYLIPGDYKVTVEQAGFEKHVTSELRLSVQQTISLDIALKVGQVSTTVEVAANTAQLSLTSSTVATVITNKAMLDLPMNGRNPYSLATAAPGVFPGGGSTPWISGGRNASSEITIDGTSIIVPENNVSIQDTGYQPIVDTVMEVAVITNGLNAEFGRTGGGVITVATRSGTNDFHGTAYDFLRNSTMDANTWSNNRNGTKLASFQRNQFGGLFAGPVLIPGFYNGRNRTFFLIAEQSTRTRSAASTTNTMPFTSWKQGDFSDYRNGAGALITIFDPATAALGAGGLYFRTPFAGNRIPRERMDPVALNMLQYYPTPNAVANNQFTGLNNFFNSGKAKSSDDRFDIRLDHNFSERFKMWSRGSYSNGPNFPFNGFGNIATSSGDGPTYSTNYNVALNAVYTLSPTTILNFSYGIARKIAHRDPISQGVDLRALGFPSAVVAAAAEQNFEFPRIDIGGNNGVSSLGQATFTTLRIQAYSHDLRGDATKVLSKHTLKFGGEFRKLFMNFRQHGQPSGAYSFSNAFTQRQVGAASSTTEGSGFASFLLGMLGGGSLEHTFPIASSSNYFGFYFQDDWRLTRRLTINIGLRWDVDQPRTERYNRLSYFDIDAASPIAGKVPIYPNLRGAMNFVNADRRRQTPTDTNNWGPRFGFAYQINQNTVFRGAYGVFYSPSVLQASGTSGSSGTQGFTSSTGVNASFDGGVTPASWLKDPFPQGFNKPLGVAGGAATQLGLGIGDSFFNDYVNPIVQEWNGTLQRSLKGGFVVEAGYLANKGNHLIDGESSMAYNQLPASYFALGNQLLGSNTVANPFVGIITNSTSSLSQPRVAYSQLLRLFPQYTSVSAFRKPQGNSIYHAFTLGVTKRYSNGLNLQLSYTAGKLLDDVSQTVTFLGAAGTKQDFYNRKAERSISAQDIPQRLVIAPNYELPFGKGRHFLNSLPKAADLVFGGWVINGIITFQKGTPLQIGNNGNFTNLGSPGQRPNNNGTSAKKTGPVEDRMLSFFDQSVFSQAGNFTFGNTSRTSPDLRALGSRDFDGSLFKRFRFKETMNVEFRTEWFTAFNHPVWNTPGTTVNTPGSFGVVTTKGGQRRQIQMALKINF
ncbi:MAG: TonB-dependent receptor [Candidatus Solibacter usitatus]|nr:TonB-dependent receptor [Candidatus Solibacter usitatus]